MEIGSLIKTVDVSVLLYGYTTSTQMPEEKSKRRTTHECRQLFWTNPESITLQNSSCTAPYFASYKHLK